MLLFHRELLFSIKYSRGEYAEQFTMKHRRMQIFYIIVNNRQNKPLIQTKLINSFHLLKNLLLHLLCKDYRILFSIKDSRNENPKQNTIKHRRMKTFPTSVCVNIRQNKPFMETELISFPYWKILKVQYLHCPFRVSFLLQLALELKAENNDEKKSCTRGWGSYTSLFTFLLIKNFFFSIPRTILLNGSKEISLFARVRVQTGVDLIKSEGNTREAFY